MSFLSQNCRVTGSNLSAGQYQKLTSQADNKSHITHFSKLLFPFNHEENYKVIQIQFWEKVIYPTKCSKHKIGLKVQIVLQFIFEILGLYCLLATENYEN